MIVPVGFEQVVESVLGFEPVGSEPVVPEQPAGAD